MIVLLTHVRKNRSGGCIGQQPNMLSERPFEDVIHKTQLSCCNERQHNLIHDDSDEMASMFFSLFSQIFLDPVCSFSCFLFVPYTFTGAVIEVFGTKGFKVGSFQVAQKNSWEIEKYETESQYWEVIAVVCLKHLQLLWNMVTTIENADTCRLITARESSNAWE